jgi:hypothetical protein
MEEGGFNGKNSNGNVSQVEQSGRTVRSVTTFNCLTCNLHGPKEGVTYLHKPKSRA